MVKDVSAMFVAMTTWRRNMIISLQLTISSFWAWKKLQKQKFQKHISSADINLSAARGCWVKDSGLHLTGQSRINWENDELRNIRPQGFHTLVQDLAGGIDLFLSSQKHQDVTWTKEQVGWERSSDDKVSCIVWIRGIIPGGSVRWICMTVIRLASR